MKHFRQSFTVFFLALVFVGYVSYVKGADTILFFVFMGIPAYIIYFAYSVLKNGKESEYELKDGWYENF